MREICRGEIGEIGKVHHFGKLESGKICGVGKEKITISLTHYRGERLGLVLKKTTIKKKIGRECARLKSYFAFLFYNELVVAIAL